jgi:FkbM family methyltransferase
VTHGTRSAGRLSPSRVVARLGSLATGVALRIFPRTAVRLFGRIEARRPQSSLALLNRVVRPGEVVVDVGAHRGVYADRLARLVGTRGHVYAFEPNPASWDVLTRVVGGLPQVTIHRVGVSDSPGSATLFRPRPDGVRVDAMSSLSRPGDTAGVAYDPVAIDLVTLDDALAQELRPIALVKIDVEGHELAVLRGAEGVLRRSTPVILVEIEQRHQEADIRETFAFLEGLGYRGRFLGAGGLRPLSEFDIRRHQTDLLPDGFAVGRPAPGYVSDFLFVASAERSESDAG